MTAKRIIVHFEDETGSILCSQLVKAQPRMGAVFDFNRTSYVVQRDRVSHTKHDFYARPERKPVDYELDGIVHG